jgi:DNA-damage-inducible protein J
MNVAVKKANVNVKIDSELKKQADEIFAEMGLSTSAAVNMFIKRVVDDRTLPFTPRAKSNWEKAMDDLNNGNVYSAKTTEQLFEDLDNE